MKKRSKTFYIGLIICGIVLLFLIIGLFVNPDKANEMDLTNKLAKPSPSHWFGCDNFGRDIFARVQSGLRMTLYISSLSVLIGATIGTVSGALTGYFGGVVDVVLMRIMDVLFAIPSIILSLVFIGVLGKGTGNVIVALGLAAAPSFAKMMRTEFIKQKEMDYVKAARLMGAGPVRILFVHILPNVAPTLLTCVFIAFNNICLAEAGLSYLGVGVEAPLCSLGGMIADAQSYLRQAPFYVFFPGFVLIVMLLGLGLLSEGGTLNRAYRK